jgi:4-hydroxy-2-oxoheptanedioate aldolase
MQKALFATIGLYLIVANLPAQSDANYKPRRLNKAIELLEDGQPIYYTSAGSGGEGAGRGAPMPPGPPPPMPGYEEGKRMSQTWADMIIYEMEHQPLALERLREFMKGIADGGPTKSGHRMPTVVVTLPVLGYDASYVKANSWVIAEILATGVMGIHLCHARDPEGVSVFVQASRYPFERPGIKQTQEGLRGAGSQNYASQIWGVSPNEYLHIADPWPLNPKGELLLGLKIEDKYALANVEKTAAVPGIGFAEWGPTDQTMSQLGLAAYADTSMPAPGRGRGGRGPIPPVLVQTRSRVMAALKANHVPFLNSCNEDNVIDMIREGVLVCTGTEATAKKGREFTKRSMPY